MTRIHPALVPASRPHTATLRVTIVVAPPAPKSRPRRSSGTRRRAGRTLFAAGGFFALLTLGLNVALDTVRPEWRDPEFGHRMKELKRLSKGRRPVVVAVGSSRSEMGLSPDHLGLGDGPGDPLVYNLSQAGCGPVHQVMNVRRLLAAGVTPDCLLVEILPPLLGDHRPAERAFVPARLSAADLTSVEPYATDPAGLSIDWTQDRLAAWSTYRLSLLSHAGAGWALPWQQRQDFLWRQTKPGGWMPYFFEDVPADKRAAGQAVAHGQYTPHLDGFTVAPTPDRAYHDLISLCRERRIRVAFYVMPESPAFRSWYPPAARERIGRYFRDLTRETGAPVFDASAWEPDETRFADGHHLLRGAAEAFSRRFGCECVGPWVRSGKPDA